MASDWLDGRSNYRTTDWTARCQRQAGSLCRAQAENNRPDLHLACCVCRNALVSFADEMHLRFQPRTSLGSAHGSRSRQWTIQRVRWIIQRLLSRDLCGSVLTDLFLGNIRVASGPSLDLWHARVLRAWVGLLLWEAIFVRVSLNRCGYGSQPVLFCQSRASLDLFMESSQSLFVSTDKSMIVHSTTE